jgi:sialate O-acetylesterase
MKRVLVLFLFVTCFVKAEVSLPSILASDMVLQQNSEVNLWGWANPTERISVTASWDQQNVNSIGAPDGTWKVSLKTPAASGPYIIKIQGSNFISLNNILVGEVWICSGQSNMALTAAGGAKDALAELPSVEPEYKTL